MEKIVFGNFYRGKKVLITGHTGFKGAWLTLWLLKLGAKVIGYSLEPPTKPNLFETLNLQKQISHHLGNVRDFESLKKVFKRYKPQVVFHLAAQPLVRKSYFAPRETFETNLMGTVNVLEAARRCGGVRAVVVVTTDKVYENHESFYGYRETDPLGGHDPYSASKAAAEIASSAYRKSFFNKVGLATARSGNCLGGGDWGEDRVIPDCVKAFSRGLPIVLRNPKATRPWQFVLEPLAGYLILAQALGENPQKFSGAWNFGPSDQDIVEVEKLIKMFIKHWGKGSYRIKKEKLVETGLLKLDASKAQQLLGFKTVYGLEQTLEKTAEWYRQYYYGGKTKLLELTLNQIKEYENEI